MTKKQRQERQAWIRSIIADRCNGVTATFARNIEKDASYVSRMLYPAGKAGAKGIGEDMVEAIRKAYPGIPLPGEALSPQAAADEAGSQIVKGLFTKERREGDDVLALQIGLESLVLSVLQRTPGAAAAFLADVEQVAKEHRFSTKAGFLAGLVSIADGVQREEVAAGQARRRAGFAARTKL